MFFIAVYCTSFFIAVFIGQELNSIKHLLDEAVKL